LRQARLHASQAGRLGLPGIRRDRAGAPAPLRDLNPPHLLTGGFRHEATEDPAGSPTEAEAGG